MGSLYNAIINPIAWVFGKILDVLFTGLNAVGLGNIAIAIVVFTLITKLLLLPLTIKQSKMTKLNSIIMPEVKAIQDKYADKRGDQEVMMRMQQETKAVYEKYGTSQMGGCVQLLIQFPILMGMYRVIQYIPMYVGHLKEFGVNILNGIQSSDGFAELMANEFSVSSRLGKIDWNNVDSAVTAMNSFTTEQWTHLKELFPAYADLIAQNQQGITDMNTFFGVNVSQNPVFGLSLSALIPILAGLSQYLSVKISQGQTPVDDDNPAAASMKMMTIFMPIMSAFIAFSLPAGLGVYWIAQAVIQTIIQLMVNRYYDKVGTEQIVAKNVERLNKKRAKKGLAPEKIAKNATANTKKIDNTEKNKERIAKLQEKKEANDKKMKELLAASERSKNAKPGSLAEKAGMVSKYNEKDKSNK